MNCRIWLYVLLVPGVVLGQEKEREKKDELEVEVRHITLSPAAAPSPALKYPLLPEVRDLQPGNAAVFYHRAQSPEWMRPQLREQVFGKIDWLAGPLSTFPKAEAERLEKQCGSILKEIDLGARRSGCNWELTDRLRSEGAWLLIPEIQGMRQLGQLEAMRARRALSDRKFDEAISAIQSGFALGQHVAETPILINCLVGSAIDNLTSVPVEDWVQLPNSPNLYWSLSDLPTPLISLRKAFQGEKLIIDNIFPGAREALADPKLKFVVPSNAAATLAALSHGKAPGATGTAESILGETWTTLKLQREAREFLAKNGRTEAQINMLDGRSIVALYLVAQYAAAYDDMVKWTGRPFWQAYPALEGAAKEFEQARKVRPEAMSVPAVLVPALTRVIVSQARLDRRIALLRSFEAIRLYAAGRTPGKLPERWADLGEIPIPIDPATGQPFEYRVEGDRGILSVPRLPGASEPPVVYHITLAK